MTTPAKPLALQRGARIKIISPSSPADAPVLDRGCRELADLGYVVQKQSPELIADGYFAASREKRQNEFVEAMQDRNIDGVICARGGYGSSYLPGAIDTGLLKWPRLLCGHSDITSLQIFLWQALGWVTLYGPMAAAGLDAGRDAPRGYDFNSFHRAVTETRSGWPLELQGESLFTGEAEGTLLGGCLTLVETTLGTLWDLDTRGSILLLEDRGMKPYQVDRAIMHLQQAGKFNQVRGIILGEFPECEPPAGSDVTVRKVFSRILRPLGIPVLWRAPIGHTPRPMLTVPLGVRARLHAKGAGRLEILEPACVAPPPSA